MNGIAYAPCRDEHCRSLTYIATEIPVGKPQVEYFEPGNQWAPRGHVVRCEIVTDAAIQPDVDEPFVSIDGRDFTLGEFMDMVGTFGGGLLDLEPRAFVQLDGASDK